MAVNPAYPARTLSEFIARAKDQPGKINMASPGTGTTPHMMGELFRMMAGIEMQHVPYRGGAPAMTDLLAGQVDVYFGLLPGVVDYSRTVKLRVLAVTSTARSEMLPDIPTIGEFVPGYEASGWFGVGVPRNTPGEIVTMLNNEINAALADQRTKQRLQDIGGTLMPLSPAEFGKLIVE
jgi:tripartite-type tricarboxylate transporter receptor subunit TctC